MKKPIRIEIRIQDEALEERLKNALKIVYKKKELFLFDAFMHYLEYIENKYELTIGEKSNSYKIKKPKYAENAEHPIAEILNKNIMTSEKLFSILKKYSIKNHEFAKIAGFNVHIVTDILKDRPLSEKTIRKLEIVENLINAGDFLLEINKVRENIAKKKLESGEIKK